MNRDLHKDLAVLLQFYTQQRQSPPSEFTHAKALISKPSFFTVKDLQRHINNPLLRPEWLHIKTAGSDVLLDKAFTKKTVQGRALEFIDKEKINQEVAKGCAMVLEGIDILDPAVNLFCSKLDNGLPCGMSNSVAFFSQRENEAYSGHCDVDDVLVVQLGGRKIWNLFELQQRRYLGISNLSEPKLGPLKDEVEMNPGDALYLKAGMPHRCSTPDYFSLHMSFDLTDRTPNIQEITDKANKHYFRASEQPYVSGSKVVDKYMDILKSSAFRTEISNITINKRMDLIEFRQRLMRATGFNGLSKFF